MKMEIQFCVHGHDTFTLGKDKYGHCMECCRIGDRKRRPRQPPKQFCPQGHEYAVVGKDSEGHCKICRSIVHKKHYQNNKEHIKIGIAEYNKNHKKELRRAARILMKEHPERRRKYALKHNNGVSPETYDILLEKQKGCCAICGISQPDKNSKNKYFCLDHDHNCCPTQKTCGKCIRGLLCHNCNRGLGQFKDNTDIMYKAYKYLLNYLKRRKI